MGDNCRSPRRKYSLFSQIFKITIALTPPTAKKNMALKYWSERNAISPNSSSSRQIAPRVLPVKHTRHEPLQVATYLVLKIFICHLWVTAVINSSPYLVCLCVVLAGEPLPPPRTELSLFVYITSHVTLWPERFALDKLFTMTYFRRPEWVKKSKTRGRNKLLTPLSSWKEKFTRRVLPFEL